MNATGASANSDSLPASLAVQAHNLYKQDLLSDIKLILADNQTFPGHKFLLTARSKEWKASQVGFENKNCRLIHIESHILLMLKFNFGKTFWSLQNGILFDSFLVIF